MTAAGPEPSTGPADVVATCADRLEAAVRDRKAIPRLVDDFPDLTVDDAYAIQAEVAARRVAAGERVIGAKLGLTSRAKQEQMGVAEPLYGLLLSDGVHPAEAPLALSDLIHPRVEPEIVFVIGHELAGPGVSAADVLAATTAVCCGLEVIDSRYEGFSFTAADVVADNTSAARIVLGPKLVAPDGIDLALVGLVLALDGDIVATATGAASLGHPAEAVALLANWLGRRGHAIAPGQIVFSGGLTAAVPLPAGSEIRATFGHLGSVGVRGAKRGRSRPAPPPMHVTAGRVPGLVARTSQFHEERMRWLLAR